MLGPAAGSCPDPGRGPAAEGAARPRAGDRPGLPRPPHEPPLPRDLDLLKELGRAEANAIRRLERSNVELATALQARDDAGISTAIEENRLSLQRKYMRLTRVSERLTQGLLTRLGDGCGGGGRSSGGVVGAPSRAWGADAEGAADPAPLQSAVDHCMAHSAPADEDASTLAQMQALLRHVKRKASELEEEIVVGGLCNLSIASQQWQRKVAKVQDMSAGGGGLPLEPVGHRIPWLAGSMEKLVGAAGQPCGAQEGGGRGQGSSLAGRRDEEVGRPESGDACHSGGSGTYTGDIDGAAGVADLGSSTANLSMAGQSMGHLDGCVLGQLPAQAAVPLHGRADAPATAERLCKLLRSLKRKAAELEEDVVVSNLCSLSLAPQLSIEQRGPADHA